MRAAFGFGASDFAGVVAMAIADAIETAEAGPVSATETIGVGDTKGNGATCGAAICACGITGVGSGFGAFE